MGAGAREAEQETPLPRSWRVCLATRHQESALVKQYHSRHRQTGALRTMTRSQGQRTPGEASQLQTVGRAHAPPPRRGWEEAKGETGKSTSTTRFQRPQAQLGSRGKEERCGPTQGAASCLAVTRCRVLRAPGPVLGIATRISFTCPRRRHPHLPEGKRGWWAPGA